MNGESPEERSHYDSMFGELFATVNALREDVSRLIARDEKDEQQAADVKREATAMAKRIDTLERIVLRHQVILSAGCAFLGMVIGAALMTGFSKLWSG